MINHHPTDDLLQAFAAGELSSSLSVVIATHAEMCPVCRHQVERYTEHFAQTNLTSEAAVIDSAANTDDFSHDAFEQMFASIVAQPEMPLSEHNILIDDNSKKVVSDGFVLPKSLQHLTLSKFVNIGKIARARISLDEEPVRTSLLNIKAGGQVPEHTHKGYEITLLLEGSFEDELGKYHPGDFIILDGSHKHHPTSKQGCWCLTVVNDSIQFTKGVNKIFNPFGKFIY